MNNLNLEVVDLASEGFFYPSDSILSSGTVEVKSMTAAEEDILCSGNLIRRGLVLPNILSRILPNVPDIDIILQCDVSTILLNSRILNYGSTGKIKVKCIHCEEEHESDVSFSFPPIPFEFSGLQRGKNVLVFIFPKSQTTLLFRLPTWKEHQQWQSLDWVEFSKKITLSIDSEYDIDEFYDRLSASDNKAFRDFYRNQTPGFLTNWKIKCGLCGNVSISKVDISTDIFNIRPESKPIIHEEIFNLCYHTNGAFTHDEVYNMPINLRNFYIKKLTDLKNEENEQIKQRESEVKRTSQSTKKPTIPSGKR